MIRALEGSGAMIRTGLLGIVACVFLQSAAQGQMHGKHASKRPVRSRRCAVRPRRRRPSARTERCGWSGWRGQVSVARSQDEGRSFSASTQVTTKRLNLDWGPDARPKIVIDRKGGIALAFSAFRDEAFNGEVLYTRSADGGKSFAELKPITANNESQRSEALALDQDGTVFAAWVDKRNRVPAKEAGRKYEAGLFFAASRDGGATYAEAALAREGTCECCRLGVTFAAPGRPAVIFRNIFDGGVRDHAVMTFTDMSTPGEIRRVSEDDWQINACPHHGPSLTVAPNGTYHVAWYTNGKARKGLFYSHSRDEGRTFSAPMALGQPRRNPTRPYVLAGAKGTVIAWKEFDGEKTSVHIETSRDDGETWSPPKAISSTTDTSDHPLLVSNGGQIYLSWMTKADGYRLIAIEDQP